MQAVRRAAWRPATTEVDRLVARGRRGVAPRQALELEPDNEAARRRLAELLVDGVDATRRWRCWPGSPRRRDPTDRGAGRVGRRRRWRTTAIEAKLDALLDRVKDDDDARQEFVDLLELLGPDDPRTAHYRKRLTARLY